MTREAIFRVLGKWRGDPERVLALLEELLAEAGTYETAREVNRRAVLDPTATDETLRAAQESLTVAERGLASVGAALAREIRLAVTAESVARPTARHKGSRAAVRS